MINIFLFSGFVIETKQVEIENGLKMETRITGDLNKPVILFANGSIFNYRQWDMVLFPALKKILGDRYCYIHYDYVGIGNSSPLDGEFQFELIADQQYQLVKSLGLDQVHLLGYSKGSLISQIMSAKYPEKVLSFAAYGSPNLADENATNWALDEFARRVEYLEKIQDIWSEPISEQNYNRVYNTVFFPTIFRKPRKDLSLFEKFKNFVVKRKLKPLVLGTKIEILYKLFSYYMKPTPVEDAERYRKGIDLITAPTLLMHGTDDEIIPISASRLLHEWIKNSQLIEIPNYRHSEPMLVSRMGKRIMEHYAEFLSNL